MVILETRGLILEARGLILEARGLFLESRGPSLKISGIIMILGVASVFSTHMCFLNSPSVAPGMLVAARCWGPMYVFKAESE